MFKMNLAQVSSMISTSHFLRGLPLRDVICLGVPGCWVKMTANDNIGPCTFKVYTVSGYR